MKVAVPRLAALGVVAAVLAAGAPDAHAGQAANNGTVVIVTISPVARALAAKLRVPAADIPASISVPVGIAAKVCPGVDIDTVADAKKKNRQARCNAETVTNALTRAVRKQMGLPRQ